MVALSEERDTPTTTEPSSPVVPSPVRTAVPHPLHAHFQHQHQHQHTHEGSALGSFRSMGTPNRKPLLGAGGNYNSSPYGRPRSSSFTTSYNTPLLVPQSPPPTFHHGGRSLSLSPSHPGDRLSTLTGLPLPFLANNFSSNEPPRHNDQQKVMEVALQAERVRNKALEQEEVDLGADELKHVLKRERNRMAKMAADLAKLKQAAVLCQAEAEIHEEGRINGLMRRLENLQLEKGRIINELEREEEMVCNCVCARSIYRCILLEVWIIQLAHTFCYFVTKLTNTLQKKLNQVRGEKAQLEKIIEQEQLHHSHLENKLTDIRQGAPEGPKLPAMDALDEEEEGDEDKEDLEREDHMEEEP